MSTCVFRDQSAVNLLINIKINIHYINHHDANAAFFKFLIYGKKKRSKTYNYFTTLTF